MHQKYGTGAEGVRVQKSHPEPDQRNLGGPRNYYHPRRQKLTQEQRERDDQLRAQQRAYGKERIKKIVEDLN